MTQTPAEKALSTVFDSFFVREADFDGRLLVPSTVSQCAAGPKMLQLPFPFRAFKALRFINMATYLLSRLTQWLSGRFHSMVLPA